tara:strand:+ start:714 stop:1205 length:492 start_codon:yes stop_codon:yes gene_type:complete
MNNKLKIIFVFILYGFSIHKYYVSTGLYEYRDDLNSLQIVIRVFEDDFTNVIKKNYELDLGLVENLNLIESKSKIEDYLISNLSFIIDGNKPEFLYLGAEKKNEVIVLYMEIEKLKPFKFFEIKNTILFDLFEDQQNIIHVKKGSQRKSYILRKNRPDILFEL